MSKDLLLIIDMQNVYAQGGAWNCPGTEAASGRLKKLMHENREKFDVIFTRFLPADHPTGVWQDSKNPEGVWKDYHRENLDISNDAYANEMLSVFEEELRQYPLYTKSVYSSLAIPEVKVAAKEANRVVVAGGVVAECCVLSTVMALIDEGDYVIYLTDGVAGIDREAEIAVEQILSGLEPLHVQRMTINQYAESIKKKGE